MLATWRWIRCGVGFISLVIMTFAAWHYQTTVYLLHQAEGQMHVLFTTQTIADYKNEVKTDSIQLEKLKLVEKIKVYSIDSLGYKSTSNFTRIYNQKKAPTLWVIAACKAYAFEPYTWQFPIVGRVSYKGFFNKKLAEIEYNHLVCLGYDVDLRSVSAWSTLGWFKDPLLSSMLARGKGSLCNLLFHELFHATYYASNAVDLNENLASFVAHKATIKFLHNDTTELRIYLNNYADNEVYNRFMLRQTTCLHKFYDTIQNKSNKHTLKLKALIQITDSVGLLPLHTKSRYTARREEILRSKNACFIDFRQYNSLQDSLERAFNKIYKANLKNLVQDLKLNGINY